MEGNIDSLPEVQHKVNWSEFDYPIESFVGVERCDGTIGFAGEWTYGPVLGETPTTIPKKDMMDYKQFAKVYYARPGANDEENWTFLVKHKNGYYIFFDAGCDYTGFDCQGGGTITYSRDAKQMWSFGLTQDMRNTLK